MKTKSINRFAHLAKEWKDFKAGKTTLKVTTVDPISKSKRVHYENYEEMIKRHQKKEAAAKEFKKVRQGLGLTQSELAMALRVSKRTLEGWESGRFPIDPPAEVLARVMLTYPEVKRDLAA